MKPLRVWLGPVASEKTTRALLRVRRMSRAPKAMNVLVFRPSKNRRNHEPPDELVAKGSGDHWPCLEMVSISEMKAYLQELLELEKTYNEKQQELKLHAILLDDPFLFVEDPSGELFEFVKWARRSWEVLVSTLGQTSEGEVISISVAKILAVADRIYWCFADCDDCGTQDSASRSFYIGEEVKTGKLKVGGESDYCALCPDCSNKRNRLREES